MPPINGLKYFPVLQAVLAAIVIGLLGWVGNTLSGLDKSVALLSQKVGFLDERIIGDIDSRLDKHDGRIKNLERVTNTRVRPN